MIDSTVAGKIVFCYSPDLVSQFPPGTYLPSVAIASKQFGAKGLIYPTYALDILDVIQEYCGDIPCVLVDFDAMQILANALLDTSSIAVRVAPTRTWVANEVQAPRISIFSSRGPSPYWPQFLKVRICTWEFHNPLSGIKVTTGYSVGIRWLTLV